MKEGIFWDCVVGIKKAFCDAFSILLSLAAIMVGSFVVWLFGLFPVFGISPWTWIGVFLSIGGLIAILLSISLFMQTVLRWAGASVRNRFLDFFDLALYLVAFPWAIVANIIWVISQWDSIVYFCRLVVK